VIYQGPNMLLLQGRGLQLPKAQAVQLIGHSAQLAFPAHPGFKAAFVAVLA
jgi:hypothetical protein